MYKLCSKLVCLSKQVKVTDNNKNLAYNVIWPLSIHYEAMFYNKSLWGGIHKISNDNLKKIFKIGVP